MRTPIIEFDHVSKCYDAPFQHEADERAKLTVLFVEYLKVLVGEFLVIIGRSGSGKSTLLNLISAIDSPSAGTVLFQGQSVKRTDLDRYRSKNVGIVFQSYHLYPFLNAEENVRLGLTTAGFRRREALTLAHEWLDRVGLFDRRRHMPGQLSGGEQQRVAIARAMAKSPQILVADEPTGNLDTRSSSEILDLMRQLNCSGTTVVMVTHDQRSAELCASRLIELVDGRIAQDETVADSAIDS